MASQLFYKEFIQSNVDLAELAGRKNIKESTALNYVSQNYDQRDAKCLMKKLGLNKETIKRAYSVMTTTQMYRQQYPSIKSATLTPYIHEALGHQCTNPSLATTFVRRLYEDICIPKS